MPKFYYFQNAFTYVTLFYHFDNTVTSEQMLSLLLKKLNVRKVEFWVIIKIKESHEIPEVKIHYGADTELFLLLSSAVFFLLIPVACWFMCTLKTQNNSANCLRCCAFQRIVIRFSEDKGHISVLCFSSEFDSFQAFRNVLFFVMLTLLTPRRALLLILHLVIVTREATFIWCNAIFSVVLSCLMP